MDDPVYLPDIMVTILFMFKTGANSQLNSLLKLLPSSLSQNTLFIHCIWQAMYVQDVSTSLLLFVSLLSICNDAGF